MMNKFTEEQERNYIYGLEKIIHLFNEKADIIISFVLHRHKFVILLSKEEQELSVWSPGAFVEIEVVYDSGAQHLLEVLSSTVI